LSQSLSEKGIKSLLPRHLNKDPLENFFGAVRSLGCDNPTCSAFITAYKTLLLNNLVSSQSPGANREDFTESSLISFQHFFTANQEPTKSPELAMNLPRLEASKDMDKTIEHLTTVTHTYIAGFIAKKAKSGCF